ncbi:MAG: hypothetical protein A3C63_00770 [Candidatus Zambryskibacteria bacterium RIFCSPHIGHO2_02_FULL_39_82]|nr:MAG: hypothetical protein A3C63_00770 [Candidatus Zambryskibacteria bacterium RIFCSPHIGHO2_02_FULL_39_82]
MIINKNAGLWIWIFYFLLNLCLVVVGYMGCFDSIDNTKRFLVSGIVFLTLVFVSTKIFSGILFYFACFVYIELGIYNVVAIFM